MTERGLRVGRAVLRYFRNIVDRSVIARENVTCCYTLFFIGLRIGCVSDLLPVGDFSFTRTL